MSETMQIEESHAPQSRLIPVAKWNDYHPWPPQGGLRYLIFHEKTNGFDSVVIRIGRAVLIDEEAFFVWARSHRKGGK
ncbi:hypothetical protein DESUT3_01390 [Desulfuromonas versatilis]|uniref:Uncharacterized protein n=1 Tax=Desulfuromonas versatilis TaxID=2802975 RepID=A0ABM9SE66_9BACT|nr:hypothetical protein [Desulfuromonas versatilis]BCR03070.1 hypothetical protein DESUT3_01390 [Desulfuromonas versatilis]